MHVGPGERSSPGPIPAGTRLTSGSHPRVDLAVPSGTGP